MKPICVPCQRFFRPVKNNFKFIEAMPIGDCDAALPGTKAPDHWKPYKLWAGDKWQCEDCGAEIVVGVARQPIDEHYTDTFAKRVALFHPQLQVNDC